MGVEFSSNSMEVQDREIQLARDRQIEQNEAEHSRLGEILDSKSTIGNDGERKQISPETDSGRLKEEPSKLANKRSIEDDANKEQAEHCQNEDISQNPLENQRDAEYNKNEINDIDGKRKDFDNIYTDTNTNHAMKDWQDSYVEHGEKDSPKNVEDGLTGIEKEKLKEETGWSDEIVESTHSVEEAKIYKHAGLKEEEINNRKCLIRSDIDIDQKDEFGRTNKERMENGNAPLTENGETVELHHIGQKQDSPLAELTTQEHRGKGNDVILHDKQKETEIDRGEFAKERKQHWESRAKNI